MKTELITFIVCIALLAAIVYVDSQIDYEGIKRVDDIWEVKG